MSRGPLSIELDVLERELCRDRERRPLIGLLRNKIGREVAEVRPKGEKIVGTCIVGRTEMAYL